MTGHPEVRRRPGLTEYSRYTARYKITLSTTYFQGLAVPSVLFHVVESTDNLLTVTAEVYVVTTECHSIFHHFPIAACFIMYKCRQFSVIGFTGGSLGSVCSAAELRPL